MSLREVYHNVVHGEPWLHNGWLEEDEKEWRERKMETREEYETGR